MSSAKITVDSYKALRVRSKKKYIYMENVDHKSAKIVVYKLTTGSLLLIRGGSVSERQLLQHLEFSTPFLYNREHLIHCRWGKNYIT